MRFFSLLLAYILFLPLSLSAQAKPVKNPAPTYLFSGNATLLSHFIERGLSMSDNKPALNASFLANFGQQFNFGFWGSNIANVNQADDNFWFKILGEIRIDFKAKFISKIYFNDNQFYTSKQRNGQTFGVYTEYENFEGRLEWNSNFEGTKANSDYLNVGKIYNYKKGIKYGLFAGYTNSHASSVDSYTDYKIEVRYAINEFTKLQAGGTFTSNTQQLNSRGAPAIFFGLSLVH